MPRTSDQIAFLLVPGTAPGAGAPYCGGGGGGGLS